MNWEEFVISELLKWFHDRGYVNSMRSADHLDYKYVLGAGVRQLRGIGKTILRDVKPGFFRDDLLGGIRVLISRCCPEIHGLRESAMEVE